MVVKKKWSVFYFVWGWKNILCENENQCFVLFFGDENIIINLQTINVQTPHQNMNQKESHSKIQMINDKMMFILSFYFNFHISFLIMNQTKSSFSFSFILKTNTDIWITTSSIVMKSNIFFLQMWKIHVINQNNKVIFNFKKQKSF